MDTGITGPHCRLPFDEVVVADTETTGLAPFGLIDGVPSGDQYGPDRLCSGAFVHMIRRGDGWIRTGSIRVSVNPERPVPEGAARVNGFHWSGDGSKVPPGRRDLLRARPFHEVAPALIGFLGDLPLVFHNAVFDAAVLDAELLRAGLLPLATPTICTKKSFSEIQGLGRPDHYVSGTNLNALCDLLGVNRSGRVGADGAELHGAEVDADLAASCFAILEPRGWLLPEEAHHLPHRRASGAGVHPGALGGR